MKEKKRKAKNPGIGIGITIRHYKKGRLPKLLATDMDGTLFGNCDTAKNRMCLRKLNCMLEEKKMALAFVTGRTIQSALRTLKHFDVPEPLAIACNVGTEIYFRDRNGNYKKSKEYENKIIKRSPGYNSAIVAKVVKAIDNVFMQGAEFQSRFKASFFAAGENSVAAAIRINEELKKAGIKAKVILSKDPWIQTSLVDVLPLGASKKDAVEFLRKKMGFSKGEVIVAGDSGNDDDMLMEGYNSIVVDNAPQSLKDKVLEKKFSNNRHSAHISSDKYACGVLEGMESLAGD